MGNRLRRERLERREHLLDSAEATRERSIASSQSLFTARAAVAAMFFINGVAGANWFVRIPAIRDRLELSTATLGLALLALPAGAVFAMPTAGWLVSRVGSRWVAWGGTMGCCVSLTLLGLAPSLATLSVALLLFGATNGVMDVGMNAQGVQVERRYGRTIMSSLHGLFSVGAIVGALLGGLVARAGVAPGPHLLAVGVGLAAIALLIPRGLLPASVDRATAARAPAFVTRVPRGVLALGIVGFCGLLAEGAMADWSAIYLSDSLGTGPGLAAAGYGLFSAAMAAGRLSGDRIIDRVGAEAAVRGGGLVAAAGLALALLVASPSTALIGLAGVGAGLSVIVPVVFGAAGRTKGVAPGSAIAAVTTTAYVGFLAGPPIIGLVASVVSLRGALTIVIALALAMAALAGTVRGAE